jgi:hypothetical protein
VTWPSSKSTSGARRRLLLKMPLQKRLAKSTTMKKLTELIIKSLGFLISFAFLGVVPDTDDLDDLLLVQVFETSRS